MTGVNFKRLLLSLVIALLSFLAVLAFGVDSFIVQNIEITGVQRISPDTVRSYLPIHTGETFDAVKGDAIISVLYKTGFFTDVQLSEKKNALIVHVQERPTISLIHISGNKAVESDKLRPVLKKLGIVEGEVFDPFKVNEIVQGVTQQYASLGYRAAVVTTRVVPAPNNLVALYINVHEGTIAKVRSITIIGNHAFTERKLKHQFKLTSSWLFTIFNHNNRYSEVRLQEDLQNLGNFYLNHGYLRFRIVSQEARLTPDKTGVDILIHVSEGPLYRVSDFAITGETFGFAPQLRALVTFKKGDPFSRQQVIDMNKSIGDFMAGRGYAFATVNIVPKIDDINHLVYVDFHLTPGNRVFVRRIHFFGNQRTDEVVLRRETRQFEASTYSLSRIEESKRRFQLLGYFDDVSYDTQPVPGTGNQVDLNYHVKEIAAGRASLQGGWSPGNGFLYGGSISEPNFMGSGKYVSLGFQNSQYTGSYSFSYTNPYYTESGMSRGFSIYYSNMRPNKNFNLQSFLMDGYGIDVNYGLPISERNALLFGYGYENIALSNVNTNTSPPSFLAFLGKTNGVQNTGATYNQFKVTGGWTYNGLDRAIFPTNGFYSGIGVEGDPPVVASSVGYYTMTGSAKYYQPLFSGFILNLLGTVGYGNGFGNNLLPFYKNFFLGGIGTVPAFSPNSLGPKNIKGQSLVAIGGNFEMLFGAHLILPSFVQKIRTAVVFDAGNVFQTPLFPGDTPTNYIVQNNRVSISNLRPSLGLAVEWYSPMGPIDLTLATRLNKRRFDSIQPFQFSFGVSL